MEMCLVGSLRSLRFPGKSLNMDKSKTRTPEEKTSWIAKLLALIKKTLLVTLEVKRCNTLEIYILIVQYLFVCSFVMLDQ